MMTRDRLYTPPRSTCHHPLPSLSELQYMLPATGSSNTMVVSTPAVAGNADEIGAWAVTVLSAATFVDVRSKTYCAGGKGQGADCVDDRDAGRGWLEN